MKQNPSPFNMKKILILLFLTALPFNCHADLKLDITEKPEAVSTFLDSFFNKEASWPYGNEIPSSYISELKSRWNPPMVFNYFGDSQFSWIFNGKTYYSSLVSFEPQSALKNVNQDIAQLFMFNIDRSIAAITPLNVKPSKKVGVPFFLEVKAMAVAKATPDSILIIISYIDGNKYLSNPHGDFTTYTTATLFRFSIENGELKIKQDDSCLGNPNYYSNISAARKALSRCQAIH